MIVVCLICVVVVIVFVLRDVLRTCGYMLVGAEFCRIGRRVETQFTHATNVFEVSELAQFCKNGTINKRNIMIKTRDPERDEGVYTYRENIIEPF